MDMKIEVTVHKWKPLSNSEVAQEVAKWLGTLASRPEFEQESEKAKVPTWKVDEYRNGGYELEVKLRK